MVFLILFQRSICYDSIYIKSGDVSTWTSKSREFVNFPIVPFRAQNEYMNSFCKKVSHFHYIIPQMVELCALNMVRDRDSA